MSNPRANYHLEETPAIREQWKDGRMNSFLEDCCRMAAGATATPSNTSKSNTSVPAEKREKVANSGEPLTHYGSVVLPSSGEETKHLQIEVILRPKNGETVLPSFGDSFFLDVDCEFDIPK